MMPPLYRGDSIPNSAKNHSDPRVKGKTWAEKYKTEGLMAKFCTGGTDDIFNLDLPYIVAAHIGYEKDPDPEKLNKETYVMNKSPLISFSSDIDSSFYFMDRTSKAKFEESKLEDATHFVWSLNLESYHQISIGHYGFFYKASTVNIDRFLIEDQVDMAEMMKGLAEADDPMLLQKFMSKHADSIVAKNIQEDNSTHYAEIINAVTFLDANSKIVTDKPLLTRAIQKASRSNEWLLFPKDRFENSFDARFSINKSIDLHHWAKRIKGK